MKQHYIRIRMGYLPISGLVFEHEGNLMLAHRQISNVNKDGLYSVEDEYYKLENWFDISCLKTGYRAVEGDVDDKRKTTIKMFQNIVKKTFPNKRFKSLKESIDSNIKNNGLTPEIRREYERYKVSSVG